MTSQHHDVKKVVLHRPDGADVAIPFRPLIENGTGFLWKLEGLLPAEDGAKTNVIVDEFNGFSWSNQTSTRVLETPEEIMAVFDRAGILHVPDVTYEKPKLPLRTRLKNWAERVAQYQM